ncbi:GNAT family N-acetyltransferase [Lachnospiraceae bacterium ZAX-1]
MIRYLEQYEKKNTRTMYEANFPEDSKSFVDYYYEYKTRGNEILVMEREGEKLPTLQVMIHLNPTKLFIAERVILVNYIVAVATDATCRKQGKMAKTMEQALRDMYRKQQPFTFLMPANPSVYRSLGFRFFQKQEEDVLECAMEQKNNAEQKKNCVYLQKVRVESIRNNDWEACAKFVNDELQGKQDIFVYRDADYYRRLMAEMQSEHGAVMLVKENEEIVGTFSYGRYKTHIELREPIFKKKYEPQIEHILQTAFWKERIVENPISNMVRILDLRALGLLLKAKTPYLLKVKVTDDIIGENNGCFEIKVTEKGGSISEISAKEAECEMDIGTLSEHLFFSMDVSINEWV